MDKNREYQESKLVCPAIFISFLCFPSICFLLIVFGYVWTTFIVIDSILMFLIIPTFIARTRFLLMYRQYATKKRFLFETISYILCLAFALLTAFAVNYDGSKFNYYFLNIYVQPAYTIFVFIVAGYYIATGKKIAKNCVDIEKNNLLK